MRSLASRARYGRSAAAVLAVAALAALAACTADGPASETAPPSDEVRVMYLGDTLEGGRTYGLPGGGWLIDVPEGMRLYYSFFRASEDPAAGALHGLRDLGTGSFIGIHQFTGEVLRHAFGESQAEIEAAQARLDRIEAAFRRSP